MNPNARLLKARLKASSVNDVGSMSLYPIGKLDSDFYIAILNSNLMFDFYREFINCTVNIQINDLRQLPIRMPSEEQLSEIKILVKHALHIKKQLIVSNATESSCNEFITIEMQIDKAISKLYLI